MMKRPLHYILFYKPYGVLSQFTRESGHPSLADFGPFPKDVYPAGRLDADSEGLLLLTNDNALKQTLTDPVFRHVKTYLVQVESTPADAELRQLRKGIPLDGRQTRPAGVRMLNSDPAVPPRSVPIRVRKNVPTCWLEVTLREGRNRQVRRMTATIGHPTLRLIRTRIGPLSLNGLAPGQSRSLTAREITQLIPTEARKRRSP